MKELYQKMIDEALAAQKADVSVIKEKRGGNSRCKALYGCSI